MNFADVAESVLRASSGGPLHVREITDEAIRRNMISPRSSTPWTYMAAALAQDSRRRLARGDRPRFVTVGRGYYRLELAASDVEEAVERWNSAAKERLHHQGLLELAPEAFEQLVAELLERAGFENIEVTRRSSDGGVDVRALLTVGGLASVTTAVQVKRWKKNVPIETVRQLRGALDPNEQGLIISASGFTKDARLEATASTRSPIGLIDGRALVELLAEHNLGLIKRDVALLQVDEELLSGRVTASDEGQPTGVHASVEDERQKLFKLFKLFKLPGRQPAIQTLAVMVELIGSATDTTTYMSRFQHRFPSITRKDQAERYIRVLVALGLSAIEGERISVTADGAEFLRKSDQERLAQLRHAFTTRIYGAKQLLAEMPAGKISDRAALLGELSAAGAPELTATQLDYLLDWTRKLELSVTMRASPSLARQL